MNKIAQITKQLGETYNEWQASGGAKDAKRLEFFDEVTKLLAEMDKIDTEVVKVYGPDEATAIRRATQHYPAYFVKETRPEEDGYFSVLLEGNPAYQAYSYVNQEDQQIYSKQISAGSLNLDTEFLQERNPELYERVTYIPQERVLKPLAELSHEDLAAVQEYIYEGRPTVKLAKPRRAKPEELEDA